MSPLPIALGREIMIREPAASWVCVRQSSLFSFRARKLRSSTSNSSVAEAGILPDPSSPQAYSGERVSSARSPTRIEANPRSHPLMTCERSHQVKEKSHSLGSANRGVHGVCGVYGVWRTCPWPSVNSNGWSRSREESKTGPSSSREASPPGVENTRPVYLRWRVAGAWHRWRGRLWRQRRRQHGGSALSVYQAPVRWNLTKSFGDNSLDHTTITIAAHISGCGRLRSHLKLCNLGSHRRLLRRQLGIVCVEH